MSENEYQESYHFVTSHPEAVARQMTHLIVGKRELEVRVKQLEAALRDIIADRYSVYAIQVARAALNITQEKPND